MEQILFSIFIIFVGAKVAGEIFERIGFPVIVGELLVGMAIGSYIPNLLRPHDVFEVIAELGVVILLFTVGLESPIDELLKVGKTAALVAIFGVIFPFALGFGLLFILGFSSIEAVFLGVALVATSVGITARVLADLGYMKRRESQIILGAAVVDDIIGLLILAIVSGTQSGNFSLLNMGILIVEVIVFVVAFIYFGTRLTKKYGTKLDKLKISEAPLIVALSLTFGLAALASYIGMAAIVGAFLAGVIFAEVNETYSLRKQVIPIYELFVPFFFVIIGSQINLSILADPKLLALTVAVIFLAVISKIIGCGLAVIKQGRRTWLKVGVGMVPRGEVGVIIGLLGLSLGAISEDLYSVIILMSMVTTFIAPFLIKIAFRDMTPMIPDENA